MGYIEPVTRGCKSGRYVGLMLNRIVKTGVAAVALAASALLIPAPAIAQTGVQGARSVSGLQGFQNRGRDDVSLRGGAFREANFRGNRRVNTRHNARFNAFGQTRREVRFLADKATYACARQLEIDAQKYGYKDGGFRSTPHIEQIGANRFIVKGAAKLFDGRNYSAQNYDCVVRRGNIRQASNLHPVRFNDRGRRSRRNNGFNGFGFSFGNIR